jgi:phosphoglycolate phosphatase-like HAD superfamily hydrolase
LFTDCIAGDEGFPMKPDPSAVEAIIERNDIVKELAVLVGDRDMDAEAGLAAGVRMCLLGVSNGSIQATYHVDHLNELRQLIKKENDFELGNT